jgi:uncharacterized membrane protein
VSARDGFPPREPAAPGGPDPGEKETGRVEAFSDGVFAIAMTLLVLDLKVPRASELASPAALLPALSRQWPTFAAYLTSFATILVMWVNHHKLFNLIRRTNGAFLFLNGLLLLFVTFVPFPTALVSEYLRRPEARTAAAIYSGTYVALAIAFNLLWRYASGRMRLLDSRTTRAQVEEINRHYAFGPALYFTAFVLAFWSVAASLCLCLGLAAFFALTASLERTPGPGDPA